MRIPFALIAAAMMISGCVSTGAGGHSAVTPISARAGVSEQELNKELIREMVDQVFNHGNLDSIDEFYAPTYLDHSIEHAHLFGIEPNREGMKSLVGQVIAGLSDMHADVEGLVAEGDIVAARVHATGVHTGVYMGVPATGRRLDIIDYHFWRFEHGKIVEHWNQYNTLEVMQQMGVLPTR